MTSNRDFHEQSYEMQAHHWVTDGADPARLEIHKTWFREDTIDFWRHRRMMEVIFDVMSPEYTKANWLTVGDGRYGLDAIRMMRRGFSDVTATDLQSGLLKISHDAGLLPKYSKQNAERLTYEDNSYDLALCKDAFHHFPRPYLALYELLRVCREAVVIIEPQDPYIDAPAINGPRRPGYEADGNFVYQTSRREFEKVALGLNLPGMACKNFIDKYVKGHEFELANEENQVFVDFKNSLLDIENERIF
jgi:SAM-dependent methyltransferase